MLCSRGTLNFVSGRIRYRVSTEHFGVNDNRPPIKRSGTNNTSSKALPRMLSKQPKIAPDINRHI
jgi:hypothetical protein